VRVTGGRQEQRALRAAGLGRAQEELARDGNVARREVELAAGDKPIPIVGARGARWRQGGEPCGGGRRDKRLRGPRVCRRWTGGGASSHGQRTHSECSRRHAND